ncbi:protein PHLOEM PROTEIN 2-LIKE A10-like [Euphorbia lathyris]|uniref:protein PHLOEM PROTEIN 2-LIKE A10-like n=1 Tax=Euphorbia lathyris TaxID=212925 RepID=UPI003313C1EE
MDLQLQLVKNTLIDYSKRNKRWVAVFAALGFSSFAAYRVYHSPSIARKRERISKLLGALISIAEVISDSADTIGVISKDLKHFLQSESDQIPNSMKQISKVTRSIEFSESVISLTQALTLGILQGYNSTAGFDHGDSPSFLDKVFDKLSTPSVSGFASVVVGSFARNLVMAFYQINTDSEESSATKWIDVICGNRCKELIGDSIQLFVSTAVAVYLDKTMHINTFDEMFAGLTNPKHEKEVTDAIVTVCNGAIETLVKTSHQVLTSSDSELHSSSTSDTSSGWIGEVSSKLAVPSNRRLVVDVTGRVTFETVRSFLEFLVEKLYDGVKRCAEYVHESGFGVVRYVGEKSSVFITVCLSLWLHILDGAWVLVPA